MFKQIKSAILWTLIYKFRKRLTLVIILLSIVLLSQWIYSDIVEYLKLSERISYLNYILPIKWIIIFTNIGISTYLILTIFKSRDDNSYENKVQKDSIKESNKVLNSSNKTKLSGSFSDKEKKFLKKKLKSEAELLMNR